MSLHSVLPCAQDLPADVRQQLLDEIYSGQPFRQVLRNLGLTSNQVWGLAKPDELWSRQLEAALTASRRDDLKHGTTLAFCADADAVTAGSASGSGWAGIVARSDK